MVDTKLANPYKPFPDCLFIYLFIFELENGVWCHLKHNYVYFIANFYLLVYYKAFVDFAYTNTVESFFISAYM